MRHRTLLVICLAVLVMLDTPPAMSVASGLHSVGSSPTKPDLVRSAIVQEGTATAGTVQGQTQLGLPQPESPADPPWLFSGQPGVAHCAFSGLCSGRVTAIALDPNDGSIYLGSAQGGVWKSTDGGQSWNPLLDNPVQPDGTPLPNYSMAVGSIAIDKSTNPSTIYVGTGEGNGPCLNFSGAGVLKSTDGGMHWVQLGEPELGNLATRKIVVDTTNPLTMLIATIGPGGGILAGGVCAGVAAKVPLGVYRLDEIGPWALTLPSSSGASDIAVDANPSIVYAAVDGSIFESTDEGKIGTWGAPVGVGQLPPPSLVGRVSLATSPSAPGTIFALMAVSPSPGKAQSAQLWTSTNYGAIWSPIPSIPPALCTNPTNQCFYDLVLAVDPTNSKIIYLGGQDLWEATDGGASVASWNDLGGFAGNFHPDQHALAFKPGDSNTIYIGNDGGIWVSSGALSCGSSGCTRPWNDVNFGLGITQFYSLATHPSDMQILLGGAQDNGSPEEVHGFGQQGLSVVWNQVADSDGGWTAIDPTNPSVMYITTNGAISRSIDGGAHFRDITTGNFPAQNGNLYCPTPPATICGNGPCAPTTIVTCATTMDPSTPTTLYLGVDKLFKTVSGGIPPSGSSCYITSCGWFLLSPGLDLTTGPTGAGSTWPCNIPGASISCGFITAIRVASSDGRYLYVGTSTGRFFASKDSGVDFVEADSLFPGSFLPSSLITKIAVDPGNPQRVFVTNGGFVGGLGNHVFVATQFGALWQDISFNLPDIPVDSIVVDPTGPEALYVGTDIGVYASFDSGSNWNVFGTGLPRVPVVDLVFSAGNVALYAATHGRAVWSISRLPFHPLVYTNSATDIANPSAPLPQLAEANCYPGDFATGGGFEPVNNGIPVGPVLASEPLFGALGSTPTGWIASLVGSASSSFRVFVVCMAPISIAGITTSTYVLENAMPFSVPAGQSSTIATVTAPCNSGDFATGGGFKASQSAIVIGSTPISSMLTPTGWAAFVLVFTPNTSVEAFAVCMKPVTVGGTSTTATVTTTSTASLPGTFIVSCGGEGFGVGGGFLSGQFPQSSQPYSVVVNGTPAPVGWATLFGLVIGPVPGLVPTDFAVCMNPDPFKFSLTLSQASVIDAIGNTHALTATLTDAAGFPVPGGIVTFTVLGANPTTVAGVTDSTGKAKVAYTAFNIGTDTVMVSAFAEGNQVSSSAMLTVNWILVSISNLCGSSASTDSSGTTVLTLSNCENGRKVSVAQIILPPGSTFPTGVLTGTFVRNLTSTMLQVTGVTVPYPPGKSIALVADRNTNAVCIVDSPNFSISTTNQPSCDLTNTAISQVVLNCNGSTTPPLPGFPDKPHTRTYTCTRVTINGQSFLRVDGLAFSFVETMIVQTQISTFFTSPSSVPLPLDQNGNPMVTALSANGQVLSTIPGQLLAWVNVTNTGARPLQSLQVNETIPVDWSLYTTTMPAPSMIHVIFVFRDGNETDITGQTIITVSAGNPQMVSVSIFSINSTKAMSPLGPRESILVSAKLTYNLKGTIQQASSYPRTYTELASTASWTGVSFTGAEAATTGSGIFVVYAKTVS